MTFSLENTIWEMAFYLGAVICIRTHDHQLRNHYVINIKKEVMQCITVRKPD